MQHPATWGSLLSSLLYNIPIAAIPKSRPGLSFGGSLTCQFILNSRSQSVLEVSFPFILKEFLITHPERSDSVPEHFLSPIPSGVPVSSWNCPLSSWPADILPALRFPYPVQPSWVANLQSTTPHPEVSASYRFPEFLRRLPVDKAHITPIPNRNKITWFCSLTLFGTSKHH